MVSRPEHFSCLNIANGVRSELEGSGNLNKTDAALSQYDAGYLSSRSFNYVFYTLGFPNVEMENAFYKDIADAAKSSEKGTGTEIKQIRTAPMKPIPNFKRFHTCT